MSIPTNPFPSHGKADPIEIGIFMFFAWPILIPLGLISLFFHVLGTNWGSAIFIILIVVGILYVLFGG